MNFCSYQCSKCGYSEYSNIANSLCFKCGVTAPPMKVVDQIQSTTKACDTKELENKIVKEFWDQITIDMINQQ